MSRVVSTWCLFLDNGDELSVQGVRTAKSLRAGTTKNLRARTSLYTAYDVTCISDFQLWKFLSRMQ